MHFHSYVDDTKLQISFKLQSKDIAVAEMNEDLRKVPNRGFRNYLLLNPDKSKFMAFDTGKIVPKLQDTTLFTKLSVAQSRKSWSGGDI